MKKNEIYSRDASVYLVSGEDKISALRGAVQQSEFVANLNDRWSASGKSKDAFLVAIKPNIMTASIPEENSPVYTDPKLVEELIAVIRGQGFEQIAVVEAENVYNYSYRGRRVAKVAEMCGYTGQGYRIASMTEEKTRLDYGGLLGEHVVGRTWLEADYRISFAKNKTHWQCYYTACLKNIYGCLPEWDKMHYYHGMRRGKNIEFSDATIEIVDRLPVHFGFLDAWVSGDGLTGHVRDADPNHTRMIFASANIFALDWVAGEKMNLHPLDNVVIQKAVQRWGTININRVGDMTPWSGWDNVRPFVVKSLDILEEFYALSRFMSRAMAAQQDPRFKPVSRFQWFFSFTHKIVSLVDGLTTKQVPRVAEANTIAMTTSKKLEVREPSKKKVLVTGANGFIGSHLVRELLNRGHEVNALVRKTSDISSLSGLPISLYIGDVRDIDTLAVPMQDVEIVFHLAAALLVTSQEAFIETNTNGTQNMLETAQKHAGDTLKRFLYVSSQAGAGPGSSKAPIDETAERRPVSWYGISKMKAEDIVMSYSDRLPVTIVRPSPVYGERERDISQVFSVVNNRIQPKLGILTKYSVMVYVEDLVRGFVDAAESNNSIGQTYFLNHPQVLTAGQVVKSIATALNKPAGLMIPIPVVLFALAAPLAEAFYQFSRERPATTRDKVSELKQNFWVADPSKARRDFGWEAKFDLVSGMKPTTDYYFKEQSQWVEMALETARSRWLKYLAIAVILGTLIEISSATGGFYTFTPSWFVFVIILGCFGFGLGTLAMLLRKQSGLLQLLAGTLLAGAVELANAQGWIPGVRWDFAAGWPFGITSPIWRSVVLGLAGGIFLLVVNAILVALYKWRLKKG